MGWNRQILYYIVKNENTKNDFVKMQPEFHSIKLNVPTLILYFYRTH